MFHSFDFEIQDYHDTKHLKSKKVIIKIGLIYKENNK